MEALKRLVYFKCTKGHTSYFTLSRCSDGLDKGTIITEGYCMKCNDWDIIKAEYNITIRRHPSHNR